VWSHLQKPGHRLDEAVEVRQVLSERLGDTMAIDLQVLMNEGSNPAEESDVLADLTDPNQAYAAWISGRRERESATER
jgi:hypothetical protein